MDIEQEYMITLKEDALLAAANIVGRSGAPPTIEAFLKNAVVYALRANREEFDDDHVIVEATQRTDVPF